MPNSLHSPILRLILPLLFESPCRLQPSAQCAALGAPLLLCVECGPVFASSEGVQASTPTKGNCLAWLCCYSPPASDETICKLCLLTYAVIHVDWLMFPLITHMKSLSTVPVISSSLSIWLDFIGIWHIGLNFAIHSARCTKYRAFITSVPVHIIQSCND